MNKRNFDWLYKFYETMALSVLFTIMYAFLCNQKNYASLAASRELPALITAHKTSETLPQNENNREFCENLKIQQIRHPVPLAYQSFLQDTIELHASVNKHKFKPISASIILFKKRDAMSRPSLLILFGIGRLDRDAEICVGLFLICSF